MKFWKRLKEHMALTLPEMRDKFIAYKTLKQLVRQISDSCNPEPTGDFSPDSMKPSCYSVSLQETHFVCLLNSEIDKINTFYVEQEENFIIRQKELQERIKSVINTLGPQGSDPSDMEYKDEMGKIRKEIVDFHGEMVLLENYSNLNYTGLAKILKKFDKRTGALLRLPFIEKVLQEPFFTTDLLSKLVKEIENTMEVVFPNAADEEVGVRGVGCMEEDSIFRYTVAALVTMREMRKGSSTYSHFSLPPLVLPESDLFQFPSPIPIV